MAHLTHLKGARIGFEVGSEYSIKVSESETMKIRCVRVDLEKGLAYCEGPGGEKFTGYAMGIHDEEIAKMGPTTMPLQSLDRKMFYKGWADRQFA